MTPRLTASPFVCIGLGRSSTLNRSHADVAEVVGHFADLFFCHSETFLTAGIVLQRMTAIEVHSRTEVTPNPAAKLK